MTNKGCSAYERAMRRFLALATLFVAGCATAPQQQPQPQPTPVRPAPQLRGDLIGMTAGELVQRLGTPALQIREGQSLKLQFRSPSCILDAYLYPAVSGGGGARVTHVDTRNREGRNVDQASCIGMIERR